MPRYDFIDSLRGLAVALVLILHIAEVYAGFASGLKRSGFWILSVSHLFDFGRMGVTIFFIISGFVIPSGLTGPIGSGIVKFLVSRFFRLFPLFWLSIIISLITQQWLAGKTPSVSDVLINATMLPDFFSVDLINGAYWTLTVELVFYAICLALFATKLLGRPIVIACTSLILTLTFLDREYFHYYPIFQGKMGEYPLLLGFMFWGALARLRFNNVPMHKLTASIYWVICIWWLFVYPMAGFHEAYARVHVEVDMVPRLYGSYFGAFAIFFFSINFFRIENYLLSYLGRISYSVYLLHGPVIYLGKFTIERFATYEKTNISLYTSVACISILTIIASKFSYIYVELRFQYIGKQISSKLLQSTNRYFKNSPLRCSDSRELDRS